MVGASDICGKGGEDGPVVFSVEAGVGASEVVHCGHPPQEKGHPHF